MPVFTVFFEAIVPGSVDIEADNVFDAMSAVHHGTIDVVENLELEKMRVAYVDCDSGADDEEDDSGIYENEETEIPFGGELS